MHNKRMSHRIRTVLLAVGLTLAVNFAISEVVESSSASKPSPGPMVVDSGGVELPKPPRP